MSTDSNDSGPAYRVAPLVDHDAVRADLAALADTARPVDHGWWPAHWSPIWPHVLAVSCGGC